jgi:hypothetical protein
MHVDPPSVSFIAVTICSDVAQFKKYGMAAPEIIPLCDAHLERMGPKELSFLPSPLFACPDPKCTRYYGPRLGYFSLLPQYQGERGKIDPVGRTLKLCPLSVDEHSFLAIIGDGNGGYWWHCLDCHRNYDRAEHPFS